MAEENPNTIRLVMPFIRSDPMEFKEGETIGAFADRASNRHLRLNDPNVIERFYVNNQPVERDYILQPGDILSGSPKVMCG